MHHYPDCDDGAFPVRLLGETVLFDATDVPFGRSRTAVVLAALLGAIGRPVSVDDLVAAVWDDDAPRTAPTMVHGAVRRIRTTVEPGRGSGPGRFVAVRHGLYVLEPATVWLNAAEFERRVDTCCRSPTRPRRRRCAS